MNIYRRTEGGHIVATQLRRFKVLVTRSRVFVGRRGDWLCTSLNHHWIVERAVFEKLYKEVKNV